MEGLVWLVAALPLIKHVTQTKLHFPVSQVDRLISGMGFMCMSTGCLIMGFSQAWTPFVLGIYYANPSICSAFVDTQFKVLLS